MAADIHVDGVLRGSVSNYSISEESTPVDPSDTSGAVGQFSFDISEDNELAHGRNPKTLRNKEVSLVDQGQGTTVGTVSNPASNNGVVTVTADSRLVALTVTRIAQPFSGTLGDALRYWISLVGLTSGIVVDDSLESIAVVFPGFDDNVWLRIKSVLPIYRAEISLVSDNIVVRPVRGRIAESYRDSSFSWSLDDSQVAQTVEIYYYNNELKTAAAFYPDGGWNSDVQIYQVDAGETITFDIPVNVSLSFVNQPSATDFVDRDYTASSVYAVAGNDGLPYLAAEWIANGGSVTAEILEDTQTIRVTIVGSTETQYAPYRIAMSSGSSNYYSALRLTGTGVFFSKTLLTGMTGLSEDRAPQVVGATIDNPAISTLDQAYDLLAWATAKWSGPAQTITVDTTGINRKGDAGSYAYPTIAEFNAANAGKTIADFNATAEPSIEAFNNDWIASVATAFVNQAFGNIAGARRLDDNTWYRIRTAQIGPDKISYTAERDTTVGDFNDVWAGANIRQFNTEWATTPELSDFTVGPLRRTPTPIGGGAGYGEGLYGAGDYGGGGSYGGDDGYSEALYGIGVYGG